MKWYGICAYKRTGRWTQQRVKHSGSSTLIDVIKIFIEFVIGKYSEVRLTIDWDESEKNEK